MASMDESQRFEWSNIPLILVAIFCLVSLIVGCEAHYPQLRREGQTAMLDGQYGPARYLLLNAEDKSHRKPETLHDLGVCSVMVAKQKFADRNTAAAFRELDNAVAYYRRAIDEYPGHQASLEGLNIALELKDQFEEALKEAHWTAEFVGPSAKQYIFLAREYEERGNVDGALLRYRQAVAMEPDKIDGHLAMAQFLMRHDNTAAAQPYLAAANQIDPKNPWVLEHLTAAPPPRLAATTQRP